MCVFLMLPYQESALLFPLCALSVGVTMGLRHQADQLPLGPGGLRTVLEGFHHLFLLAFLPVLLNQASLGHALRIIQHHWGEEEGRHRRKIRLPNVMHFKL